VVDASQSLTAPAIGAEPAAKAAPRDNVLRFRW
jgi:hypothetical protein